MNSNLSKIYYTNPKSSTSEQITVTSGSWVGINDISLMTYKNVPQFLSLSVINAQNNGSEIHLGIGTREASSPDILIGRYMVEAWKSANGLMLINNSYDSEYKMFVKSSGTSISYPSMQYIALNLPKI